MRYAKTSIALLIALPTLFLLRSCIFDIPNEAMHDEIISKLNYYADSLKQKNSDYAIVDMDKLAGHDWEHIYFFHENSGYPTDEGMSKAIGIRIISGGIIGNGTRLIFTKDNKITKIIDFSQQENVWLYTDENYSRSSGTKFAFYINCNYTRSYKLKLLKYFKRQESFDSKFYKPCY